MLLAVGLLAEPAAPAAAPATATAAAPAACGRERRFREETTGQGTSDATARLARARGKPEGWKTNNATDRRWGRSGGYFDGTHLFRLGLRRGLGRARLRRRSRSRNRARPRRWESPRPAGETRTPPREPPTREARRRGGEMSMRTPSRFARARVRKRERGRPRPRARGDHRMPHARLCARSDVVARGRTRADGWSRKRAP